MTCVSDYWKVYQRALLPKTAPHLPPRTELLSTGYLLKNKLLFARWSSDFDCGFETEWYCVIKDDNFSVDSLKAKRRYEINKGNKNFYCNSIDPIEYFDAVYEVFVAAFGVYPIKYRPQLNKLILKKQVEEMVSQGHIFIGAFDRMDNTLKGVAVLICNDDFINYSMHKVVPNQEKRAINAALVYGVLSYCEIGAGKYKYIIDGERAIKHITGFQDYLIKYFGFRKVYCKLNILYNPLVNILINGLFPFRKVLSNFKENGFIYNVLCVLEQERIRRTFL